MADRVLVTIAVDTARALAAAMRQLDDPNERALAAAADGLDAAAKTDMAAGNGGLAVTGDIWRALHLAADTARLTAQGETLPARYTRLAQLARACASAEHALDERAGLAPEQRRHRLYMAAAHARSTYT